MNVYGFDLDDLSRPITDSRIQAVYSLGASTYEKVMSKFWEFDRGELVASLSLQRSERVLEIGVGTGRNLFHYPTDVSVVGIDFTESMLKEAKKKVDEGLHNNHFNLLQMDAQCMDFADDEFDAALQSFVLCVVVNPVSVLQELIRVTKRGSLIAMFDYCRSLKPEIVKWQELIAPIARTVGFPPGVIVWDPLRDYEEIIKDNNLPFEIVKLRRYDDPNPFLICCSMLLCNVKG